MSKPLAEQPYLVTSAADDGAIEVLCGTLGRVDVGLESGSVVIGRHDCRID